MRKLFLLAAACTLWLMFSERAVADIVYEVHQSVDMGSVAGTITTDGTVGPLSTLDIVSFDLNLFDWTTTASLIDGVHGGSVFIGSGGLIATPTQLLFDFNASGPFVNFFTSPGCTPLWSLRTDGGSTCNGISGTVNAIAASATTMTVMSEIGAGTVTIGVIPEPGSLGLLVAGLVSLIGLRKLRF